VRTLASGAMWKIVNPALRRKARSTLSPKTATDAENGEKTATVAEFGDSRTLLRQSPFSATVWTGFNGNEHDFCAVSRTWMPAAIGSCACGWARSVIVRHRSRCWPVRDRAQKKSVFRLEFSVTCMLWPLADSNYILLLMFLSSLFTFKFAA